MSTVLGIWDDDAMTTLMTSFDGITSDSWSMRKVVGSPAPGIFHRRKTLPGTNQLQLSVVDNDTGDVLPLTCFKFALTEAGLATAVAGAPLNLGVLIESGTDNGLPVWIKLTDPTGIDADYSGPFSLQVLDVRDFRS